MSDYSTTALLVLAIVTVAALTVVFFLIIPLRVSLSLHSRGREIQGTLSGSWFIFGLDFLISDNDPRMSLTIGSIRVATRPVPAFTSHGKKSAGANGIRMIPKMVLYLTALTGLVLGALLDLIRHTRLEYFRGSARIGFGDPAATGVLFGLFQAFRAIAPGDRFDFSLIPEFSDEMCEIDLKTRFRIILPIRTIVNVTRIIRHPASRLALMTFRQGDAGVAG